MASSSQIASSSLFTSAPQRKYDVFLSFRGEDTREGFLSHLYHELQNMKGINTFKDDKELQVGALVSPTLSKAIEESRFAIIVLSPNFASSSWCLEELTKIVHCMEDEERILPLFYHVDPSDVRHQKKSFEVAFMKHEEKSRHDIEKVKQWRDALKKVANFSGWHTQNYKSERELVEDIVKFVWNKVRIEIESTVSTTDFEAFQVTRQAMHKVMKVLKNDHATIIGVYGMGGVGKTTMVKHVGAKARKRRLFDQVITAVISQNPDLRKIQGTFADLLGLKFDEESEIGRAARLKEKIMRGTRILIILDDIWNKIEFSSIGIPCHEELQRCNSKVILTTRRVSVCYSMESHANIPLNILSENDSWSLFVKEARKSFDKSADFYEVASKVARECAGLPVALIAVARALRHSGLDEWKEAARRLKASQPANPEDEGDVFKCIKLSYDYLKSDDSKSCFLLCCLFPEDYDIQIEDLLMYGIGKGLFQDSNMHEARTAIHVVVKALKASSLLLDSEKDGCVRIHDVIRDFAISISIFEDGQHAFVKAGCKLRCWPKIPAQKGYSALSVMKNDIRRLPEDLVCSKLQILLLQRNAKLREIPESFFQTSNVLKVLDLSKTRISLLPTSFCLLTNLHTLYLDGCRSIGDMSYLGKLKNLEILSMRNCRPKESKFPKEIGYLTNLRMLDITNLQVDSIPSKVISRLSKLEELHMLCDISWEWGSKVVGEGEETNVGFDELTGLSYLNMLKVRIPDAECLPKNVVSNPNWFKFDIFLGILLRDHDHYSRVLSLNRVINALPDWFINVVVEKAEKLRYFECEELANIVVEHDQGRLHALKYLVIEGAHENLEELMNTTTRVSNEPVLEKLEELDIRYVDGLKQLCVGELPPESLCNLKKLDVAGCLDLGNTLLPSKLLQRLENLEDLNCEEMNGMEYVFGSSSSSDCLEPQHTTNLRILKLWDLENLVNIWNGPAPHTIFHNLKALVVFKCMNLKSLFTSAVAQGLLQLEDLWVEKCLSIERLIIESSEENVKNNKMIIVFPKLKNLVLYDLPRFSGFCNSGSATIHIKCPSLGHLHLKDCPQFSTFASHFRCSNKVKVNFKGHYDILYHRLWHSD